MGVPEDLVVGEVVQHLEEKKEARLADFEVADVLII